MNVSDDTRRLAKWHPGKIGLLWVGGVLVLMSLWFWDSGCRGEAATSWAVLMLPVLILSWRWFGRRETAGPSEPKSGRLGRVVRALGWLVWALLAFYLFVYYADCVGLVV